MGLLTAGQVLQIAVGLEQPTAAGVSRTLRGQHGLVAQAGEEVQRQGVEELVRYGPARLEDDSTRGEIGQLVVLVRQLVELPLDGTGEEICGQSENDGNCKIFFK